MILQPFPSHPESIYFHFPPSSYVDVGGNEILVSVLQEPILSTWK